MTVPPEFTCAFRRSSIVRVGVGRPTPRGGTVRDVLYRSAAVALLAAGIASCGDETPAGIEQEEEVPCLPNDPLGLFPTLPARLGPPATTTGTVPHQQTNAVPIPEVIAEMSNRIFASSEVEARPSTIVDGATAIWLRDAFAIGRPECIIRGRELGHIHEDGSLHITLPHGRIPGAEIAGWAEGHPWANSRAGFEAYVMIFSPQDVGELDVIVELVADGLAFVEGD